MEIIQSALSISGDNLRQAQSFSDQILKASTGVSDHVTAANNCLEHLRNAEYRLRSTVEVLPRGGYKHARAWMSGGLAYQYDCWSALKYVNDTKLIHDTMSFLNNLISLTSNGLSLIRALDVFGDDVAKWAPVRTERDGFWESGGALGEGGELRVPDAVNAGPDWSEKKWVIWVKEGIIQSALSISGDNLRQAQSFSDQILKASTGVADHVTAANNCLEHLRNAEYRLRSTVEVLPRGGYKHARAWMSGGLAYQYDCWSALKYVNDTKLIHDTMSFLNNLISLTSNGLSLIRALDVFGDDVAKWAPVRTERDGFWESGGALGEGGELRVPVGLKADVTVCKSKNNNGGCDYGSVQDAVNAGPDWSEKKWVIWVKEGVYEETVRVGLEKRNVVVYGDGIGKTVITGNLNVGQPGLSTYNTATFGVVGDGFMASGLTIENTAGPDAHQAVAFRSDSDQSIIENCEFLGNQDTLYAHSLRQFYKSCIIQGNVDFIFGNSASIFQDCTILVRPRQLKPEKGENNAVTAHGRIDPAQSTGFVFQNCLINGTEEYMRLYYSKPKVHKNYLGRPWKEFSRTVFIDCNLEALITPQGWMPWTGDFALKTLYYGESGNTGKGSDLSARVTWSSQIPAEHVNVYSVGNFLQGDQWKLTSS
ncbi:pectinesterase inhibitor domain, Pectin lyase fold/virulence factor [Artemisia annua]|uniref:pectinesterase n=1 Tax=Artemisia annua TaxID=35608 RepID=A0A2U1NSD9_ARTAN|nr:pectinesterase inhibitor domain, Pectin lyase fold/virulence factor [Artemisia annua]